MKAPKCPKCKVKMIRRKSKFGDNYWWGCPNFPSCKITCAEHPDGRMMSIPANKETKDLKIKAHELLNLLVWNENKKERTKEQSKWLQGNTTKGHIGLMNKEEVLKTINKIKKTLVELGTIL